MWQTSKWILAGLWVCAAGFAVHAFVGREQVGRPALVTEHLFVLVLTVVALGLLVRWAFYQDALAQLRRHAWLYCSSQALGPTHIRPASWYRSFFIERPAVDLTRQALLQRQGVVLRGAPLVGKTRCAYQVLKRLRGYWILGLTPTNHHTADIKIPRSYFFGQVRLILLLDDLPQYVGKFSLGSLLAHLRRHTASVSVLATCCTDDLQVLQHGDFSAYVTQTLQNIAIEPLSQAEEEQLAHACGQPWETADYTGTPGVLSLNLRQHKQRLAVARYESQHLMRAISLIEAAGIHLYSQALVERVATWVYGLLLPPREIEQVWRWLCETGLVVVEQGIVRPVHSACCGLLAPLPDERPQADPTYALDTDGRQDRHFGPKEMDALWQVVREHGDSRMVLDMTLNGWVINQDVLRAEQGLRQYVSVLPGNAAGHYNLGLLLAGDGRTTEAMQAFRTALSTDPLHAGAYYNLGVLCVGDGLRQDAADAFRAALRCDPFHAGAHNNLGLLLVSQERAQEAGQAFQTALRCDPNLASAHYNMGLLLAKQSLAKEAALAFDAAARCDPEHTGAHNNLGVLLAGQGRVSEAAQAFRAALSADPDDADAHYNLGVLLAGQGQIDVAATEYRAALRCYPRHTNIHRRLDSLLAALAGQAHLHTLTQEVRLALSYRPEVNSDISDIGTYGHNQLGVTLVQKGLVAEAQREFEAALQENPTDVSAHYNLGVIWANRECMQEAEYEFLATLRYAPHHAGAHNNLGVLRASQGRFVEAEHEYRAALLLEPSDAQVYSNLAILLARAERMSEAYEAFQDALRCQPHNAGVYNDLGIFLVDQGKTVEALEAFQAALHNDPSHADARKNLAALSVQRDLIEKPNLGRKEECDVAI